MSVDEPPEDEVEDVDDTSDTEDEVAELVLEWGSSGGWTTGCGVASKPLCSSILLPWQHTY